MTGSTGSPRRHIRWATCRLARPAPTRPPVLVTVTWVTVTVHSIDVSRFRGIPDRASLDAGTMASATSALRRARSQDNHTTWIPLFLWLAMIRHIVLFTAKDKADIEQMIDGLSVLTAIPHARRLEG